MKKWASILISPQTTIIQTMKTINDSGLQFALVVDEQLCLLGTVTDGDIRRGLLKGLSLDESVIKVMNSAPLFEKEGKESFYYKEFMKKNSLKQLPIVNEFQKIKDVLFSDEIDINFQKKNVVLLMVGGLGTRLRPLTENVPKPMLKVGEKPILETIINGFKDFGFVNFVLSVNYKKEVIKEYFKDGSDFEVNISYIEENKRLGTAGAISLLDIKISEPIIVMNGDLLTRINYEKLLEFHKETKSLATMCVREYEYQIPYGVIETSDNDLISIKEKPIHKILVNAGVYVLSPDVLKYIPQNEFYDMPSLFKKLVELNSKTSIYQLKEYWLDMGCVDDYKKANGDFEEVLYD